MGAFFTGLIAAVILAVVTGFALNSWDLSSRTLFSTKETKL
jgi:hypothetical protein